MRNPIRFAATISLLVLMVVATNAQEESGESSQNWPQWRGPNFDGTAAADPPVEWGPEKNIRWKVKIPGRGSSTPIVWGDKIFVLTAVQAEGDSPADEEAVADSADNRSQEDRTGRGRRGRGRGRGQAPSVKQQFIVLCLDRDSGEEIWQTVVKEAVPHESGHNTNTFASASPVTDGQHVFASFGSQGVFCLDMEGQLVWQRDLGKMQTRNQFGEGSSPALHDDTLVVPFDHEGDSKLFALDAASGETRWEVDRDERTTWCTPYVVEFNHRAQVIMNGNRVRSYDLKSGDLIWECGGQVENPIPSPVRMDDVIYCMTGYRGNAIYAIPLQAQGDITDTEQVVWRRNDAAPYVPSPTLYEGTLYFTKSRDGIVSSLNAKTGEVVIKQSRLPDIESVYASPVAAQGRVYFTGRDGTTVVIRHHDELDVLATNSVGEPVDASPVMVGNNMFIRGESHLFCIGKE